MGTDAVCFAELCESFASFAVKYRQTAKLAKLRRRVPQRNTRTERKLLGREQKAEQTGNPRRNFAVWQYFTAKDAKDSQSYAKQTVLLGLSSSNKIAGGVVWICSTGVITMRDPFTAGLLSFIIPGLGQFYNGRILAGILWLIITPGLWIGSGGTLGWICHIINPA
jgi:TM2 domain-containing membrane protein YozV